VIFIRQAFFIYLSIRIFLRKLHHHTSRRSDDLDFPRLSGSSAGFVLRANAIDAVCPTCQQSSDRVHSYYDRFPRDLPVSDHPVQLILTVRRFRCLNTQCFRKTFAEPLPDFVPFHSQRTVRLTGSLRRIGFSLGGEAGARLTKHLNMTTSPDTLLRILGLPSLPASYSPQILGVDDFALQKGYSEIRPQYLQRLLFHGVMARSKGRLIV
jgi:hypothetical protein